MHLPINQRAQQAGGPGEKRVQRGQSPALRRLRWTNRTGGGSCLRFPPLLGPVCVHRSRASPAQSGGPWRALAARPCKARRRARFSTSPTAATCCASGSTCGTPRPSFAAWPACRSVPAPGPNPGIAPGLATCKESVLTAGQQFQHLIFLSLVLFWGLFLFLRFLRSAREGRNPPARPRWAPRGCNPVPQCGSSPACSDRPHSAPPHSVTVSGQIKCAFCFCPCFLPLQS